MRCRHRVTKLLLLRHGIRFEDGNAWTDRHRLWLHVVQLATDALDEVRRELWREARKDKNMALAKDLKGARFAFWKNPEHLTEKQQVKLAEVQKLNGPLYRAYLLKEQLRQIYQADSPEQAERLLEGWLSWAKRCRIPAFAKLARTIVAQRDGDPCRGPAWTVQRDGGTDQHPDQADHQAHVWFHSAHALIALATLTLSGLCPPLPGR